LWVTGTYAWIMPTMTAQRCTPILSRLIASLLSATMWNSLWSFYLVPSPTYEDTVLENLDFSYHFYLRSSAWFFIRLRHCEVWRGCKSFDTVLGILLISIYAVIQVVAISLDLLTLYDVDLAPTFCIYMWQSILQWWKTRVKTRAKTTPDVRRSIRDVVAVGSVLVLFILSIHPSIDHRDQMCRLCHLSFHTPYPHRV